jgi:hypothetical protein
MTLVGDALGWARKRVTPRVPEPDLDHCDPDYIRDHLPGTWLLASLYFRTGFRGLDRIPADEPVLLVGNHSGGNVPPAHFIGPAVAEHQRPGRAPASAREDHHRGAGAD